MKIAIIDTETNGLPDYKLPADDPKQPRLAALGIIMLELRKYEELSPSAAEANGNEAREFVTVEAEHEFLVKPDGWAMTEGAAAINGLTDERLNAEGLDVRDVLRKYTTLVEAGYVVAAYGAQHDCKILRGELRRAGLPDLFEATPNVCLMRACLPLKVPKANGKGGWPRLEDACRHFGVPPEPTPHSALQGARCVLGVLLALSRDGKLPAPEVHYAKNRPEGAK